MYPWAWHKEEYDPQRAAQEGVSPLVSLGWDLPNSLHSSLLRAQAAKNDAWGRFTSFPFSAMNISYKGVFS